MEGKTRIEVNKGVDSENEQPTGFSEFCGDPSIGYSIRMEARNPEKNILRFYSIAVGQDLFGNHIVELTYGRIGGQGRTKTVRVANEDEAKRLIKACLKKRERAHKRIGTSYKVIAVTGDEKNGF